MGALAVRLAPCFARPALAGLLAKDPNTLRWALMQVLVRHLTQPALPHFSTLSRYLRIDTSAAEGWLTCAFKELPLPTGVPRVLDVQARFEETGEYTGSLQVCGWGRRRGIALQGEGCWDNG